MSIRKRAYYTFSGLFTMHFNLWAVVCIQKLFYLRDKLSSLRGYLLKSESHRMNTKLALHEEKDRPISEIFHGMIQ
jgi:hypothetical protein